MKLRTIAAAAAMFILAAQANAFAAARAWELDKAHSNIYFSIDHIFSKTRGLFDEFTTEINFDPADLAGSSFAFTIETDSINTNIAKRDKHLRSADFFDSGTFPLITFTSKRITDAGGGVYNVSGTLRVKQTDYDLTLPLTLVGVKEHPAKKGTDVAGFNGTVTIDRLAYKIGNGRFFERGIIGRDVDVLVTLEVLSGN